jgi:hypothetical protein
MRSLLLEQLPLEKLGEFLTGLSENGFFKHNQSTIIMFIFNKKLIVLIALPGLLFPQSHAQPGIPHTAPAGHSSAAIVTDGMSYQGLQDPNHTSANSGSSAAGTYSTTPAFYTVGLFLNDTTQAFAGYTLFAPGHNTMTYLINNDGRKVHEWTASTNKPGHSVYLLENGHLFRTCEIQGPLISGGGRLEEYDWDDNLVWQFNYSTSNYTQHHDAKKLPNGNVIMLVAEKKTLAEAIAAGFNPNNFQPEVTQKGYMLPDCIIEVQPTVPSGGNIVWEWHVWDHLIQDYDPAKANYGVVNAHPELVDCDGDHHKINMLWNHMNCIDYNPALDQIAVSVRGNDEVWIIDHSTTTAQAASHTGGVHGKGGDLLYRWGNPLTYGRGTINDEKYFQQHDVEWIKAGLPGAGDIMCFNNGITRSYSTVDEITPPVDANGDYTLAAGSTYGPSSLTWTYQGAPPSSFYAHDISGAQRLPNGNTLIDVGTSGTFFEVTSAGVVVWKYINPTTNTGPVTQGDTLLPDPNSPDETMNAVFRIYRYAPGYPAFTGRTLTPGNFIEIYPDSVQFLIEGLYNSSGTLRQAQDENGSHWSYPAADKIDVELHDATNYDNIVYTAYDVFLNVNGIAAFAVPSAYHDNYYLAIKHRNSLMTISATPVSFASGKFNYNFTTQATKAYGSNQEMMSDGKWAFYSGDVNQDEIIDGSDLSNAGNLATLAAMGYLPEDVNSDGLVDGSDLSIIENNAVLAIGVITP